MTCDWLRTVTRVAGHVAPPISVATPTTVSCLGCSGWWVCFGITWDYPRSVEVLLLTWAHVLIILWCCLTVLCFVLLWTCLTARDYLTVLPFRLSRTAHESRGNCGQICTFTVYISCSVMASGDDRNSQPAGDRSGQIFWCEMHPLWDPPKTYVDLTSLGGVVSLRAFDDQATLVRVLPGDYPNIVRVLVPDECAEPRGFHDLLLEDLSSMEACHVRPASAADLTKLRQQWSSTLLTRMTKCQVDMESLHWDCKRKFGNSSPGDCPHCDHYVNTSLSRHIMTSRPSCICL